MPSQSEDGIIFGVPGTLHERISVANVRVQSLHLRRGIGQPGLNYMGCHQAKNLKATGIRLRSPPGHLPRILTPTSMALQGLSMREICEQVKDRSFKLT